MIIKKTFLLLMIFCLASSVGLNGCRKSSPEKKSPPAPPSTTPKENKTPAETPAVAKPSNETAAVPKPPAQNPVISKSLEEIILNRNSWNPILTDFYGKQMPDFEVTDITGKTHRLSAYRGKNVVVVLWATWCVPCMEEVPQLVALRDIMSEDKLAMLAISNEPANVVKSMAGKKNMTYTVISYQGRLPAPFSNSRSIPTAFFIRPDGTLKIVTEGGAHLSEMKSIILAQ
ncbi:MAG: TlpA disulfide reductase family protein [Sedimentisphaerales bacterium]|jgi:peroxiredoxin